MAFMHMFVAYRRMRIIINGLTNMSINISL